MRRYLLLLLMLLTMPHIPMLLQWARMSAREELSLHYTEDLTWLDSEDNSHQSPSFRARAGAPEDGGTRDQVTRTQVEEDDTRDQMMHTQVEEDDTKDKVTQTRTKEVDTRDRARQTQMERADTRDWLTQSPAGLQVVAGKGSKAEPNQISLPREVTEATDPLEGMLYCACCFEDLAELDRVSPDGCQHRFCLPCLSTWIEYTNTCPLDRHRFWRMNIEDKEGRFLRSTRVEFQETRNDESLPLGTLRHPFGRPGPVAIATRTLLPEEEGFQEPTLQVLENRPLVEILAGSLDVHARSLLLWRQARYQRRVRLSVHDRRRQRAGQPRMTPDCPLPLFACRAVPQQESPRRGPGHGPTPMQSTRNRQASGCIEDALQARAHHRYQNAIQNRATPIHVPSMENPLTYRLMERVQWARNVTAGLLSPRNQTEARWRIQSPTGQPFPHYLPVWANYWHIGETRKDAKGNKRGGTQVVRYDLSKLLWMEGFPASAFPCEPRQ